MTLRGCSKPTSRRAQRSRRSDRSTGGRSENGLRLARLHGRMWRRELLRDAGKTKKFQPAGRRLDGPEAHPSYRRTSFSTVYGPTKIAIFHFSLHRRVFGNWNGNDRTNKRKGAELLGTRANKNRLNIRQFIITDLTNTLLCE